MAEQLKRLSPEDHEQAERLIRLLTDGSSTVSKVNKGQYLETLTEYQQRVRAEIEAPNPEQAERIEKLAAEIKALREEAAQSVPRAELERVTGVLERVQTEGNETIRLQQDQLKALQADLEKASGEGNPRVVELKEQVAELQRAQRETTLKQQQIVEGLEADVERLTRAAEEHPRQIQEITRERDDQAEAVRILQLEMRGYQEAGMEVARTPLDQAEAQSTEARRQHGEIVEDTPEAQVNKEVLAYKISLLEAKHKEHLAIQERLLEAHQAGVDKVSRSPEYALRNQAQVFEELQEQMKMDAAILTTSAEEIPQRLEEIGALRAQAVEERERIVDAESQGPEVQLQALRLDQAIAKFDNQLRMLTSLQETLGRFVEIGRGEAGQGLIGLQRAAGEALEAARVEFERLNAPEGREARGEAIAVQEEKVRGLEAQVESLRVAVERYQEHAATEVLADAQFLQQLIAVVPGPSQGEAHAYLMNAVKAIKAMQETLVPRYPERVAHSGIERLLKDIYSWQQACIRTLQGIVLACQTDLGRDINEQAPKIAGFVGQLVRKQAEILRLVALPQDQIQAELDQARLDHQGAVAVHGPLDAVVDGGRDEVAIANALNEVQFHDLRVLVLETIQAQQHQPLLGAHAAEKAELEWQKSALGTMQRMIVGFFSMLFSIPGVLIGGLQTMGHPIIGNPNH